MAAPSCDGHDVLPSSFTDNAHTVDLFMAVSHVILQRLPTASRDILVSRFGESFLSPRLFERNILSLQESELSFLDEWNDAQIAKVFQPSQLPQDVPWVIYRSGSLHHVIHGIILSSTMHPISAVSAAFTAKFGWTEEAIRKLEIQPQTLVHRDDITTILRRLAFAASSGSAVSAISSSLPASLASVLPPAELVTLSEIPMRIMNSRGKFVLCHVVHFSLRAPNYCPVVGLAAFEMME